MQHSPEHDAKRRRLIRVSGGFAIAVAFTACVVGYLRPSKADIAAEQRLLGKWGMWIEGADQTLPTQRIVEWLPNGQAAHYSPTMEPWGNTSEMDDRSSDWRIRNGKLIIEMQAPETEDDPALEEYQLDWLDEDSYTLTIDAGSGKPTTVMYRRIESDNATSILDG
ncbi:hypothetical protein NZK35_31870 [Stieleria sp. ICT_E10.1]|uniref:hypothetical protein n=1 Tax=Stieleria sedimenti TaxID=2976331 RepID=UPI00217FA3FB|nr:hypothetical protein [Stieleria sedimenti]MCS7471276.1 hypothetical protein [Stieleria sedimenti]